MAQSSTANRLTVQRIEPAYRQVASQLRRMVIDGTLEPGAQLPSEEKLGVQFGVSRNTIREALRMLSSQNLTVTKRGVAGGTFIARPDPEALQESIVTSLQLLNGYNVIDVEELFETRLILEVPSARGAALRRTDEDLERLRLAATRVEHGRTVLDRTVSSQDFHQAVIDAAGNRLISLLAPPVWDVFQQDSLSTPRSAERWEDIDREHLDVLRHIEAQRPDEAAEAMRVHLERLHASR
ncbi:FadR/GntR family transcriptional regulator [Microbacterium sp. 179-B 1A2 NHS]|uniref:FadR/GntR family transcriptional regulator n=1 Tax=Microbacterium sp. 179-B 1A2 NHS TaxID=3142383 RepID=UPI0039A2EBEA